MLSGSSGGLTFFVVPQRPLQSQAFKQGTQARAGSSTFARPVALHAAASGLSSSGLLRFQFLSNSSQLDEIQSGHGAKHAAKHDHHNTIH
jgi:hypothetical protein